MTADSKKIGACSRDCLTVSKRRRCKKWILKVQVMRAIFQRQIPQIVCSLKSIADSQEKLIELQMQNTTVAKPAEKPTVTAKGTIYVCYEENSTALYTDAVNINHMFVTTDEKQMREWVSKSLQYAENDSYHSIDKSEREQFLSEVGDERIASVWVYFGRKEESKENYGICVDCFDLSKSAELLESVFAQNKGAVLCGT